MKSPFLEHWSRRRERDELLETRGTLELTAAQLSSLSSDSDVRATLQKSHVASLLPPAGTEVFRRFTPASLERIQKCVDAGHKLDEEDDHLKPAPELESGKVLPFFYGAPPPELLNVPLEDPDPFYQSQKTFVVVTKGNVLTRFNAESSCFHFSAFSLFRRAAIKLLNFKLFTLFLLATLLANYLFMVPNMIWGFITELVFLSVYSVEAVLKILSRGFCLGRFTYLRDSWNRLDVVIVVTGFFSLYFPGLWFFKSLRYLKLLGLFSGTRRHAKMFGRALNRLWDVFFLTLLVLTVFSLIGMAQFSGSLRNKCVLSWGNDSQSMDQNATEEFDVYFKDSNHYYFPGHSDPQICGNGSWASPCPVEYVCIRTHSTPQNSFTNFDSFEFAFLATFRLMTRDFWEALAAEAMQAEGTFTMVYFVAALFVLSFSLTAFIIAAFVISFTEQTEEEVQEAKRDQRDHSEILAALKDQDEDKLPEKKGGACTSCWRRACSCDCCGCWVGVKKALQVFVLDPFFDLAIVLLIVLNVGFMSMEHFPLTPNFEMTLTLAELFFSGIFALEVVLKILALGPYAFFQVGWHVFDTVLVVFSLLNLSMGDVIAWGSGDVIVFRLFRLARWWPGFLRWMRLVWAGLRSLWFLSLVVVVFFFSVLGNLFFGMNFSSYDCVDCPPRRWHMGDVPHSFMTVMRALSGEWIETMWECLMVSNHFACVTFYVSLLIVGNFLSLTLFWTLLMKWINNKLAPKDEESLQTLKKRFMQVLKVCGVNKGETTETKAGAAVDEESVALSCVTPQQTEENGTQSSTLPIGEAKNFQELKETEDSQDVPHDCCCQKCYSCCPALDLDASRGCGRVWSRLRRGTFNIVQHPYFGNGVFFVVLVSSAALVFEDMYLPTRPTLMTCLGYLDQGVTYLFVLEVLFKWLGLGFRRYFTDGWCWLDLVVTLACVLSVAAQTSGLGSALVSLKALRPLRILAHVKGTRVSVSVLLRMLPSLLDVLFVTCTVWLFFAIVLIQSFAGSFYYCINETSNEIFHPDVVPNKSECFTLMMSSPSEVSWKNAPFNFDSIPAAHLTLFSMATFKGWIDTLYNVVDSRMVEDQPMFENNVTFYLFFVNFFLFGCFFCCIHILKVLLDSYSSQTRKGRLRARLYDLVSREAFEWAMQGVIFAGVVLMMTERYDMTEEHENVLFWLSFALGLLFAAEAVLKICAFRLSYFSDGLNVIDFVVVVLSVLGLILSDVIQWYFLSLHYFHLLRLGRITRIVHRLPGALRLRLLASAWARSLLALRNLGLLLFVLASAYASFGTFHFAHLRKLANVSDVFNFETFWGGLASMSMAVTWAGWDALLLPSLRTPPDCDLMGTQDPCGNPTLGVAFILSFLCLSSYVVLLMLLVLLVDMLNAFAGMSCDPLSPLNVSAFFKAWKKFVPDSALYVQRSQLLDLCDKLKKPLRIPKPSEPDLDLGPDDPVHCRDVLLALSVQALGGSADKEALRARIKEKYHEFMPGDSSQDSCESSCTLPMNQERATPAATVELQE